MTGRAPKGANAAATDTAPPAPGDTAAAPDSGEAPVTPPAPAASEQSEAVTAPERKPVETADYLVLVSIGGTRDGEPVPGAGETWTLPIEEGDEYARFGYVKRVE